jgi:hypothetical protein
MFAEAYKSNRVPEWFKQLLLEHRHKCLPYRKVKIDPIGNAIIDTIRNMDTADVIMPDNHVRADVASVLFGTLLAVGAKFYTDISTQILRSNFETSNFDNWYKEADLTSYESGKSSSCFVTLVGHYKKLRQDFLRTVNTSSTLTARKGTVRLLVTIPVALSTETFQTETVTRTVGGVTETREDLIIHISLHNFRLLFTDEDLVLVKAFLPQ